jgi:alpha-ketoglutarate-dependent taurine dioxygenase
MQKTSEDTRIIIDPLGYALGAEIRGLDISLPPNRKEVEAVNAIWQEHHVIVF